MRFVGTAAIFIVLASLQIGDAPLLHRLTPGCPPSKTWTTGPDEEAGFVLAEEALAPIRIAGPFEMPWAVALLPDGSFLVTERQGRLQHVRPDAGTNAVAGVPSVLYAGHGGLLDVELDPDFEENHLVYLSYLQGKEAAATIRVMRAKFAEKSEALTDEKIIYESSAGANSNESGGRLALTGNGYLFLSTGDRGLPRRAQHLSRTLGAIIRIKTDGTVPRDNPFVGTRRARPEIWSYGHRNPQGLAYDRATGQLWSDEHGPQGGDELNLIYRGGNYGWPIATFGVDYSGRPVAVNSEQPGTELPVHYWVPLSIAPSSLAVETGPATTEIWIGALAGEMVVQLTLAKNCVLTERHLLRHQLGRIRDVRLDATGALYVLTDGGEGELYRVELPRSEIRGGAKSRP